MESLIEKLAAESTTYVNTKTLRQAAKSWLEILKNFPKFDPSGVHLESMYLGWAIRNSDLVLEKRKIQGEKI